MCDEHTEADNEKHLRLSRRDLSIGASATVVTLLAGCKSANEPAAQSASAPQTSPARQPEQPLTAAMVSTNNRMVTIATPDGEAEAFFVAPASGRHPGVLLWPDVAGLREAFETMATRLAAQGYAVLAINPYYRSSKIPVLKTFAEWRTDAGKAKIAPMREALTADAVAKDGAAFVNWLDKQEEVDGKRKIGTIGYCMGGPFTFRTAAAMPDRVGAIASFHGAGLVTQQADSPHTLLPQMKAALLVCIAENDDAKDPEGKSSLQAAAKSAGLTAEVEVYPAQHGWCVVDSPVYDQTQADRAWNRMIATLQRL